ncbi:iporin [Plakobranchus ocellatus]|uniref:Iporin n=1 Tax=Plakobranchus ocellatus TaxID=259542 RepID=A0AAV4CJQ5_9GAST|nr:iporin [Plakobranchus ocellatus]
MPSPGTGFCLGLTMDGNDNISPATVTTLPLQSSRNRTWQGASTIPVRRNKGGRTYSLDNQRVIHPSATITAATTATDTIIIPDTTAVVLGARNRHFVDNQPVKQATPPAESSLMEAGPVIRMGTGALGPRKRGDVTNWKEISPKKETVSPLSSPAKSDQDVKSGPSEASNETENRPSDPSNPTTGRSLPAGSHGKSDPGSPAAAKNSPKRQNSSGKSPRLARKLASAAARNGSVNTNNSNLPPSPKKSPTSTSSSSLEANSPKRGKPKGRSAGGHHNHHYLEGGGRGSLGQIDKLKFADRYKIGADFSSRTGSISSSSSSSTNRLTTWKDISPTESKIEGAPSSHPDRRARPESGYFSNEVHSESREGMEGSQSSESEHAGTIKHRPKAKKVTQPVENQQHQEQQGQEACHNGVVAEGAGAEKNPGSDGCSSKIHGESAGKVMNAHQELGRGEAHAQKEEQVYCAVPRQRYRDSLDVEAAGLRQTYRDSLNLGGLDDSLPDLNTLTDADKTRAEAVGKQGSKIPRCTGTAPSAEPFNISNLDGAMVDGARSTDSFDGIQDQPASQDEGSLNDYFFDEDFIVQYDGNLQASVGVLLQGSCAFSLADSLAPGFPGPQDTQAGGRQAMLPHSFNGSYNTYGALRDSFLQNEDLYSGPCDESEVSGTGSRTSMDVSSSEREMMCSSDMLDFPGGDQPLFTPPVATSMTEQANLSTDSLSRHLEGDTEVTATTSLSGSRSSSTTADITVKCGPHKDAYFLSFDGGSQGKFSGTESESSYVSQTSSQDDKHGSRSISSGGDAEDEQSSSFQFANHKQRSGSAANAAGSGNNPTEVKGQSGKALCTWNMKGSRYPGRICLEALQEYLSQSSGSPNALSQSAGKLSPMCAALLSSGELEKHCTPKDSKGSFIKRSGRLTTWKQIRNLRNLSGTQTGQHERSKSLPELTMNKFLNGLSAETSEDEEGNAEKPSSAVVASTQSHPGHKRGNWDYYERGGKCCDMDEAEHSFHRYRHSSYVLDLYQRLQNQSNPPSPDTLAKIDQILLKEGFINKEDLAKSEKQQQQTGSCCHSAASTCDSACSSGHYPFYNMCVQRSAVLHKRAQLRAEFEAREKLRLELNSAQNAAMNSLRNNTVGTSVMAAPEACCCTTQTMRSLRLMSSKETLVSPGTVTLWLGTKNFSSQFPPKTQDCSLQTSLEADDKGLEPLTSTQGQQTSPYTPEKDLFSLLEEVCAKYADLETLPKGNEPEASERFSKAEESEVVQMGQEVVGETGDLHVKGREGSVIVRESARALQKISPPHSPKMMHRAASANDCQVNRLRASESAYRTASLSPSRMGMTAYYTHRSLPDLGFLTDRRRSVQKSEPALTECLDKGEVSLHRTVTSLFDPVKIPIILSPLIGSPSEHPRSQSHSPCRSHSFSPARRQTASYCCCSCPSHPHLSPSHSSPNARSHSSPAGSSPKLGKKSKSCNDGMSGHGSPARAPCSMPCCNPGPTSPPRLKKQTTATSAATRSKSQEAVGQAARISPAKRSASYAATSRTAVQASVKQQQQRPGPATNSAAPHKPRSQAVAPPCSRLQKNAAPSNTGAAADSKKPRGKDVKEELNSMALKRHEKMYSRLSQEIAAEERKEALEAHVHNGSDGSSGFTPSDAPNAGGVNGCENYTSSKSTVSTASTSSTSSSSSAGKKVTSGQYVVSGFSSSSSSPPSDQRNSSTSTIDSRDVEIKARIDTGSKKSSSRKVLAKQNSTDSEASSVPDSGDSAASQRSVKKGRIPVLKSSTSPNQARSPAVGSAAGAKNDGKQASRLPTYNKTTKETKPEKAASSTKKKFSKLGLTSTSTKTKAEVAKESAEAVKAKRRGIVIVEQEDGPELCHGDGYANIESPQGIDQEQCGYDEACENQQACQDCLEREASENQLREIIGGTPPPCFQCDEEDCQHITPQEQAEEENEEGGCEETEHPVIDGRNCANIPADLEHILFQPPHLESSLERENLNLTENQRKASEGLEEYDHELGDYAQNGQEERREYGGEEEDEGEDTADCKTIEVEVDTPPSIVDQLCNSLTAAAEMKSSASGNALLARKAALLVREEEGDLLGVAAPRRSSPRRRRKVVNDEGFPLSDNHKAQDPTVAMEDAGVEEEVFDDQHCELHHQNYLHHHHHHHHHDHHCLQQHQRQHQQLQDLTARTRRWSTGSSLNKYNFEALYSLQEESSHSSSTASTVNSASNSTASYDDFHPPHSSSFCRDGWHAPWTHKDCCHSKHCDQHLHHHCHDSRHHDQEAPLSSSPVDEEIIKLHRKWLRERKPLKSCLRKTASGSSLEVETLRKSEKSAAKAANRYSIACDGNMPILVAEDGFPPCYTNDTEVVRRRKPKHKSSRRSEKSSSTCSSSSSASSLANANTAPSPATSASASTSTSNSGSSCSDESSRSKRVSFAAEVSFQSPHQSPRRASEKDGKTELERDVKIEAIEVGEDTLTLHLVKEGKGDNKTSKPHQNQVSSASSSNSPDTAAETKPPAEPAVEPTVSLMENNNLMLLKGIAQAAESLLQHFSQAKDPFEKLRLGSSVDSPQVAALVYCELCPAVERVVSHGMRDFEAGAMHIFGKVKLSPWKVAEMTSELGPYTRPLHDLAKASPQPGESRQLAAIKSASVGAEIHTLNENAQQEERNTAIPPSTSAPVSSLSAMINGEPLPPNRTAPPSAGITSTPATATGSAPPTSSTSAWKWFKSPAISNALASVAAKIGSGSSPTAASTPAESMVTTSPKANQERSLESPKQDDKREAKSSEGQSEGKKGGKLGSVEKSKGGNSPDPTGRESSKPIGVNIPDDSFLPAVVRDHSSPVERYLSSHNTVVAMSDLFEQEEKEEEKEEKDEKSISLKDHNVPAVINEEKLKQGNEEIAAKEEMIKEIVDNMKDDYTLPKFIDLSQLGIVNENYTNSIRSDDIDWEAVALYEERVRKIDEPIKIGHNSVCYALSNVEVFHRNSACGAYYDDPVHRSKGKTCEALPEIDKTLDVLQGISQPRHEPEVQSEAKQVEPSQEAVSEKTDSETKKIEPKPQESYKEVKCEGSKVELEAKNPEAEPRELQTKTSSCAEVEKNLATTKTEAAAPIAAAAGVKPAPTDVASVKPPVQQKKSPSSRFSLLSFFDRILLPHDRSSSNNKLPAQGEKPATVNEETAITNTASPSTTASTSPSITSPSSTGTSASALSPTAASTNASPTISPKTKDSTLNDVKPEKSVTPRKKAGSSKRNDGSPAKGKSNSRDSTPTNSRKGSKLRRETTPTRTSKESSSTQKDVKSSGSDAKSPNSGAVMSTTAPTTTTPVKKPSRIRSLFFKSKAPPNPDKNRIIQEEKISPPVVSSCKIITTAGAVRNKSAEQFGKARPLSAIVDREFPHNLEESCEFGSPESRSAVARPLSLYDRPYSDIFHERYVPGEFLSELTGGAGLIGSAPSPVGHAPFLPLGRGEGRSTRFFACDDFSSGDASLGHRSASSPCLDAAPSLFSTEDSTAASAAVGKEPQKTMAEMSEASAAGLVETSFSESGSSASIGEARRTELKQSCEWDDGMPASDLRYVVALNGHIQTAETEDRLAFQKGDHLQVLAQLDSQYLYCTSGKSEGLVDLSEVRPMTEEEVNQVTNAGSDKESSPPLHC